MSHLPRPRLIRPPWAVLAVWLLAGPAFAVNPHVDPAQLPNGCPACHQGHGVSGSPMLPAPQAEICLSCHGSQADRDAQVAEGMLASTAQPQLMSATLSQPHTHPISDEGFSRYDPEAVVCTSCHSPHRGAQLARAPQQDDGRRRSPRHPDEFEYELCQGCHGSAGVEAQSLLDLSRLTNPSSRSFHPIEVPTVERSPSTLPEWSGREVNCTDCHGNSDGDGIKGPHGSSVRYLLVEEYATVDGTLESAEAYGLCYSCHDRKRVLDSPLFPLHRLHVEDHQASCATCHSPHGSVENRALVRFGEETLVAGVEPSLQAGQLAFVSEAPGSGSCYLICHGVDHTPKNYGVGAAALEVLQIVPKAGPPGRPGLRDLPVVRPRGRAKPRIPVP